MKNYSRPRPTLPDSTPFLPGTRYSLVTPWHGDSTSTTHPQIEGSQFGSLESSTSLRKPPTIGVMPSLSVNSKSLSTSRGMSPARTLQRTENSVSTDVQFPLTPSVSHSVSKPARIMGRGSRSISLTERSLIHEEIIRKTKEAEDIKTHTDVIVDRTRSIQENLNSLAEVVEDDQVQASKVRRTISNLSKINMTLIDILQALDMQPETDEGLTETMLKYRSALLPDMGASSRLLENGVEKSTSQSQGKLPKNDLYATNAKLRQMVLTMSREYYRSSKQVKNAFTIYEGLRSELRAVEQRNRMIQHDLDEIRKEEEQNATSIMNAKLKLQQQIEHGSSHGTFVSTSDADKDLNFEDGMKEAVKRKAIEPSETVLLLQRLYTHVSSCPANLDTDTAATHVVSKTILDILRVQLVSLFLVVPGRAGFMHKYTVRSMQPTLVDVASSRSLVREVIKLGMTVRVNDTKTIVYDDQIDSCISVPIERVLSVPLRDVVSGHVFGVIHIINKRDGDIFTASDDMILRVFTHHVGPLLSSCKVYQRTVSQNVLLDSLAKASLDLASVVPKKDPRTRVIGGNSAHGGGGGGVDNIEEITGLNKPLLVGEVLNALENVTKDALKCHKVRAFLVTSEFIGLPPGNIAFLEKSAFSGLTRHSSALSYKLASIHHGIAGHVAQTMAWDQCVANSEPNDKHSTEVDLDPNGDAMITFPVRLPGAYNEHQYETGVVAVIQMVLSGRSPKIIPTADDYDGISILFATLWYLNIITPQVLSLLSNLGGRPLKVTAPSYSELSSFDDGSESKATRRVSYIAKQYRRWSKSAGSTTLAGHMASTKDTDMAAVLEKVSSKMMMSSKSEKSESAVDGSEQDDELEEVDVNELENMKRKIAALIKANEKLKNPTTIDPKLLSAKAIMDGVQAGNKSVTHRRKSEKFIRHQINEAQRQLAMLLDKQRIASKEVNFITEEINELRGMCEDLTNDINTIARDEEMLLSRVNDKEEQVAILKRRIFESTSGLIEKKLEELTNAKQELETMRTQATQLKRVHEEEEEAFGKKAEDMKRVLRQVSKKLVDDEHNIKDPVLTYELGKVKLEFKEERAMKLKQKVIDSTEQSAEALAAIRDYQLQLYGLHSDLLKLNALIDEKKIEISLATKAHEHRITEAVAAAVDQAQRLADLQLKREAEQDHDRGQGQELSQHGEHKGILDLISGSEANDHSERIHTARTSISVSANRRSSTLTLDVRVVAAAAWSAILSTALNNVMVTLKHLRRSTKARKRHSGSESEHGSYSPQRDSGRSTYSQQRDSGRSSYSQHRDSVQSTSPRRNSSRSTSPLPQQQQQQREGSGSTSPYSTRRSVA